MGEKMALILQLLLTNRQIGIKNEEIVNYLSERGFKSHRKEVGQLVHNLNDFFTKKKKLCLKSCLAFHLFTRKNDFQ